MQTDESKKLDLSLLPHNDDAEKAVLASLILDNNLIAEALETFTPEHFYNNKHKSIFQAIVALAKEKKPVDLIILCDRLKDVIPPGNLTEILSSNPTTANFPHHAEILKGYYVRRLIIKESSCYIEQANLENDYSELLGSISQRFSKLAQEQIKTDIINSEELAKIGSADFANRLDNKISYTGLSSGYAHLDRLCGGFGNGDLIIVAGATNIGKSALLLDIVNRLSLKNDHAGAYFSLEMNAYEIFYRLVSKIANVDLIDIKTPKYLKDKERQDVIKAMSKLSTSKFFLDVTPVSNINKLIAKAKKIKAKENIEFVCIDYLQLISFKAKDQARHEILSEITKDLKQLARELNIPVIAGAQLNRNTIDESEPKLSHIGESFAIVQHADTVILLSKNQNDAVLHVAKARQAAGGRFELNFDFKTVSFIERKANNDIPNDRY